MAIVRIENWAFKVFCLSTIFITVFSVQAIYDWPSIAGEASIFLACILPIAMVLYHRIQQWLKTKETPKELLWVILVSASGLLSCLVSENPWASLKSMGLFIITGPLVFFTAKLLFESTDNQERYFSIATIAMLALGLIGIYEHFSGGIVYLYSRNPLPAGALLILLSAGPLILLQKNHSTIIKLALVLGITSSTILIIMMAKKSHLLSLTVLFVFLIVFSFRKYYKFVLGFIVFIGFTLFSSDSLREKYSNMVNWYNPPSALSPANPELKPLAIYGSIPLRAENYLFGFHVFKKNPVLGLGFRANFDPYFVDYDIRHGNYFSKKRYQEYIKSVSSFENIILTYMVEWGGLFSIIYFGGVIYLVVAYLRRTRKFSTRDMDGGFLIAILFSFSILSLTFDTLRFPNLNWIFHSFLGLLASLPKATSSQLKPFPVAADNPRNL